MMDIYAESEETTTLPLPRIKKRSGPSLVWLIPLITVLIGGWLIFKSLSEKGPEITITFKTAEGIEAGKTKIKYKEIEIGLVDSVHFSKDFSLVIVKARMEKDSASFLRRDTRFWVVKPRLDLRGVTGLGTLLSGAYIDIEPGQGAAQRHFIGLDAPPVVRADVPGTKIVLLATKLGSIDTGSPIYYQGILTGEVLGWELGNDRKSIFIYAFVKTPYDKLIQSNTRFWNVSGIDISVNSEGVRVRTESVQSFLYGGIGFETPATLEKVKENVEGLIFTLYDNYESIQEQAFTKKITFILFFEGSVRGLSVGAPVEFKGIKVGSVKDVRLEFNQKDTSFRIPVLIEIEPERIIERGGSELTAPEQSLKSLADRGLRAQLQTGNLLTGQLFVDLDMHPATPARMMNAGGPYPELPTIPGGLEQMTTSLRGVLAKIEGMDMDKIGAELLKTLQGTSRLAKGAGDLVNKPELRATVDDLRTSMNTVKTVLHKLDQRIVPIEASLENALAAGHKALEKGQMTLTMMNEVLKPDSPLQSRWSELTDELAETARSIRTLVDLLERNPNAVIFGKDGSETKSSGAKR